MFFKKRTPNNINLREVNEHRKHFEECYPNFPINLMKKTSIGMKQLMVLDVAAEDLRHRGDADVYFRFTRSLGANSTNNLFFIYPEKGIEDFPSKFLDYISPDKELRMEVTKKVKSGEIPCDMAHSTKAQLERGWEAIKGDAVTRYLNAYFCASENGAKYLKTPNGIEPPRVQMMKDALSYLTYFEHGDYEKRESLFKELEELMYTLAVEAVDAVENADSAAIIQMLEEEHKQDELGNDEKAMDIYHQAVHIYMPDAVLHDTRVSDIIKKYVTPYAVYWGTEDHDVIDPGKDFDPDTMWDTSNMEMFVKKARKRINPKHAAIMEERHQQWLTEYGPDAWKR